MQEKIGTAITCRLQFGLSMLADESMLSVENVLFMRWGYPSVLAVLTVSLVWEQVDLFDYECQISLLAWKARSLALIQPTKGKILIAVNCLIGKLCNCYARSLTWAFLSLKLKSMFEWSHSHLLLLHPDIFSLCPKSLQFCCCSVRLTFWSLRLAIEYEEQGELSLRTLWYKWICYITAYWQNSKLLCCNIVLLWSMLTWPSLISWHWSHFARVYICEWRLWDLLSYTTILFWYYNTKMSVMGIQIRYWGCKVEASAKAKNIRVIKMMEVPLLLPS